MFVQVKNMDLRQILYFSNEAFAMNDGDLHGLRGESLTNNSLFGVTGLLLYVDRIFVQVIEGPDAAIGQLYTNIRQDERNKEVVEMFDRGIDARAFPAWSMGFHSPGAAERNADAGFHNLRNRGAFEAIDRNDQMLFSMMQKLYTANAGRGF